MKRSKRRQKNKRDGRDLSKGFVSLPISGLTDYASRHWQPFHMTYCPIFCQHRLQNCTATTNWETWFNSQVRNKGVTSDCVTQSPCLTHCYPQRVHIRPPEKSELLVLSTSALFGMANMDIRHRQYPIESPIPIDGQQPQQWVFLPFSPPLSRFGSYVLIWFDVYNIIQQSRGYPSKRSSWTWSFSPNSRQCSPPSILHKCHHRQPSSPSRSSRVSKFPRLSSGYKWETKSYPAGHRSFRHPRLSQAKTHYQRNL